MTYQRLELLVVGSVLGNKFGLVGRNIASEGFSTLPTLKVVVRAIGSLADDAELSRFHALDLGDLLEQLSRRSVIHSLDIYICIYFYYKNKASALFFQNYVLRPHQDVSWPDAWSALASEARHRFGIDGPSKAKAKRRRRCALPAHSKWVGAALMKPLANG